MHEVPWDAPAGAQRAQVAGDSSLSVDRSDLGLGAPQSTLVDGRLFSERQLGPDAVLDAALRVRGGADDSETDSELIGDDSGAGR